VIRRPSADPSRVLAVFVLAAACGGGGADRGADWRPATAPQRIVAGSVFAAEALLAALPRERLAGVHELAADARFSLVPDTIAGLPLVGAEPEQLLAVRPDLVVTDPFTRPETQALLEAAGVPVLRTPPVRSFADVAASLRQLGRACHCEAAIEAAVRSFEDEVAAVRRSGRDLAAWRICSLDGALHTYGAGSLFDAVATAAGATNLAAERGVGPFRKLDVETLLAWRPDALVIGVVGDDDGELAWLLQHPGLKLLPCVQGGRLVLVPNALLSTTSQHLARTAALVQAELRRWGRP
jgi:iron complex transport system substrate-binding protein